MAPWLLALWLLTPPAAFPHGTVALVSEPAAAVSGGEVWLGLQFALEPGWHIYWENPGDSGEAPRVAWRLPAGWSVGALEWPRPQRLGSATIVDYGYENGVLLLAPAHAGPPGGPARLAADLRILICKNECIPTTARVGLALPVLPAGARPPQPAPATARAFTAARAALPRPLPAGWSVTATEDARSYTLTIHAGHALRAAQVFPLSDSQVDNAAPVQFTPTPLGARVRLGRSTGDLKPSTRLPGVLALAGGPAYTFNAPVGR